MTEIIKLVEEDDGDISFCFEAVKGPHTLGMLLTDAFKKNSMEPVNFVIESLAWFLAHELSGQMENEVCKRIKELTSVYRKSLIRKQNAN